MPFWFRSGVGALLDVADHKTTVRSTIARDAGIEEIVVTEGTTRIAKAVPHDDSH